MQPERLIPQPELRQLFGNVSDMTIWRWRKAGLLPKPVVIRRRNYYREREIAELQASLAASSEEVQ